MTYTKHFNLKIIRTATYSEDFSKLEIVLARPSVVRGGTRTFLKVPPQVFRELENAPDPDRYYQENIENKYRGY